MERLRRAAARNREKLDWWSQSTRWDPYQFGWADFRDGSILLKKSKIELLRKSREGQFLIVSAAASPCGAGTRGCGRFCAIRCGPSHCRAWGAPAGRKNFDRQPEKTFPTVSVKNGSGPACTAGPLYPQKQTSMGWLSMSALCPNKRLMHPTIDSFIRSLHRLGQSGVAGTARPSLLAVLRLIASR